MAVFRVERTRDYTVMCNHHLKDSNLSLKAKGLLSMIPCLKATAASNAPTWLLVRMHPR